MIGYSRPSRLCADLPLVADRFPEMLEAVTTDLVSPSAPGAAAKFLSYPRAGPADYPNPGSKQTQSRECSTSALPSLADIIRRRINVHCGQAATANQEAT